MNKKKYGENWAVTELRKRWKIPLKVHIETLMDSYWKGKCHYFVMKITNDKELRKKGYYVPHVFKEIQCER